MCIAYASGVSPAKARILGGREFHGGAFSRILRENDAGGEQGGRSTASSG